VLNKFLADYKLTFATTAPLVNATLTELGTELKNQADWSTARTKLTGYIQNGQLSLTTSGGATVNTPLTAPAGTSNSGLGAYGGYFTGWRNTNLLGSTLSLPSSVGYTR
jgi:hypothetical protein